MSAKELAAQVRDEVDLDFSNKVDPDTQHLHSTALEVAKELGMEPNALNVGHVMEVLRGHVTAPSKEYPKTMYFKGKEAPEVHGVLSYDPVTDSWVTIVNNSDEEKELGKDWLDHHNPELASKSEPEKKEKKK